VQKLGKTLKLLIEKHNLNTLELSKLTGVSQPVIYRIVSGKTFDPKISTLCLLANYFGITVNQLIGDKPFDLNPMNKLDSALKKNRLLTWEEIVKSLQEIKKINSIFKIRMNDDSMDPLFSKNSLLIFDTTKKPKDNSYVLVHIKGENTLLFRQLLFDSHNKYLKPLNSDSEKYRIKCLSRCDKICGVLVQARRNFQI
jgi:transcriptional regulator with XRE-family HTH domain